MTSLFQMLKNSLKNNVLGCVINIKLGEGYSPRARGGGCIRCTGARPLAGK